MNLTADIITFTGNFTLRYADLLANGITPQIAARKPTFETATGLKVIDTNHATFIFGHLGLYPTRIFTLAGLDTAPVAAPAAWSDLFKAGVQCQDDPKGTIYPAWDQVLAHYKKSYETAIARIASMDESFFARENPDPKARERFPTIGKITNFLLNNHPMSHLGQVSTWRRCMGLPSAM
jgi:hypothetical protein